MVWGQSTMSTRKKAPPVSARIFPDSWLVPIPLARYFPREQPLEVDVGCGKGRFLLARAAAHPDVNHLGLDRMLKRVRKVDRKIYSRGLDNVRLLRMEAYYAVTYLMPPAAVRTYYIFFPDPWPKKRHLFNRLFDARFLDAVHRTLAPGGALHFATDHEPYFEPVRDLLRADARFREIAPFVLAPEERTDFELLFLPQKPIGRCSVVKA